MAGAGAGLAALLLVLAPHGRAAESELPVIFGAASTTAALSELAAAHERTGGPAVRLSFASSSTLARQILNGARPAVFLSANRVWMDALDRAGLLAPGSRRVLLGNQLVMIRRRGAQQGVNLADPDALLAALGDTPLLMGDPAHVPAGGYAREALVNLALWDKLSGRVAFAPSARAVTVRVARGEAPLGLTYASELSGESGVEAAAAIPPQAHSPIRYELALIGPDGGPVARAFYDYLLGATARTAFLEHGFLPPPKVVQPGGLAKPPLRSRLGALAKPPFLPSAQALPRAGSPAPWHSGRHPRGARTVAARP